MVRKLNYETFFQGESVEKDEAEFHRMLKKKAEDDGGKLKVVDVSKKESEIEAKEIMSLTEVIAGVKEKFPGLNHVRIPICNSANPLDRDFDALCATLVGSNVNCPVIVNCQVINLCKVFENHRKSLIHYCERSELR